jgi:hypothetical protein
MIKEPFYGQIWSQLKQFPKPLSLGMGSFRNS